MHGLRLSANISYCLIGGERVFLDLSSGSYFRLHAAAETLFAGLESRTMVPARECRALVEDGILTYAETGGPIRPPAHPHAIRSLVEEGLPATGFSLATVAEVALHLAAARWAVRWGRWSTSGHRRAAEPGDGPEADRRLGKAAAQFITARRFVPLSPNCLRDSMALQRFLARRGIEAALVVGAKLHPFAAHCWLQRGDTILNDSLTSATGFAPILVR